MTYSTSLDESIFQDFSAVADRVIFRLVSRDSYKSLLPSIPYVHYLDLTCVFLCLVSVDEEAQMTFLIKNSHMARWGIDTDTLYRKALTNTPRLLPYELFDLRELLAQVVPEADEILPSADDLSCPMYVLSNSQKLHGAACVVYENLLGRISERLDDDYYVLPSSIHEVLLIPAASLHSKHELDRMVQEVNETQVADHEVLADHAYYYSRVSGKLSM